MANRKPISKKKRFDIFKRDGFSCAYCGRVPPQVVLEVDHVVPVIYGGENDEDNLVTSCFDCNRGKRGESLSVVPESLKEKAASIQEAEAQLKAYYQIIQKKKDRLENETWVIIKELALLNGNSTFGEYFITSRKFIEKLGYHQVFEAAEIARIRQPVSDHKRFKYFCGICWNKVREQNG